MDFLQRQFPSDNNRFFMVNTCVLDPQTFYLNPDPDLSHFLNAYQIPGVDKEWNKVPSEVKNARTMKRLRMAKGKTKQIGGKNVIWKWRTQRRECGRIFYRHIPYCIGPPRVNLQVPVPNKYRHLTIKSIKEQ